MVAKRRGVSLIELLVAVTLLAVVAGAALRSLVALGRQSVAVSEHAAVQAGVRTGMMLVEAELRGLGADAGDADLLQLGVDSITYRAPRGFGVTCALSANQVRVRDGEPFRFSGLRAVAPGRDSLLLFVEGDSTSRLDDRWIRLPVYSVGSSSCGTVPAIAIGTGDLSALLAAGAALPLLPGGPVRTFEVVRIAEYQSGGERWLGMASISGGEAIQPVAGPLVGAGLTVEYLGATGAPVVQGSAVRQLRIALVGAGDRAVGAAWTGRPAGAAVDSLLTRITLRNVGR